MASALIVSDSDLLRQAFAGALKKDGIEVVTRSGKVESDYLVLAIKKEKGKHRKLLEKFGGKAIIVGPMHLLSQELLQTAAAKKYKVYFYNLESVTAEELAEVATKGLYGFADSKVFMVGEDAPKKEEVKPAKKIDVKKRRDFKLKFPKKLVGLVGVLVLLPYLILGIAILPLLGIYSGFKNSNNKLIDNSIKVSRILSSMTAGVSSVYLKLPVVGRVYQKPLEYANLATDGIELFYLGFEVSGDGRVLVDGLMNGSSYDLEGVSRRLSTNSDALYRQLSFFETRLKQVDPWFLRKYDLVNIIATYRPILQGMSLLSQNMYEILGGEGERTYLVLFQNNMELRPTGGFIGSIGLLSVDNGRMTDFNIYDVYDADGQLKGYVEAPEPLQKYLGEESWFLRDSNWSPDFPTSAERAEWFLDKSLQKQVDGVIGVNLEMAKAILEVTGPVELDGFGDRVDENNMYSQVQSEVENNFFPGSTKKKNYLTALAQALIARLNGLDSGQSLVLAKRMVQIANARDIQMYFNDETAERGVEALGWDGEVKLPICEGECSLNWLQLVEANLGVNKANYNVARKADMIVKTEGGSITNTMYVTYTNTATDISRIPELRYKNYLRLFVPDFYENVKVKILDGGVATELEPDISEKDGIREIGVLVDIAPAKTRTVEFEWSAVATSYDKMLFEWDKQSGVTMPITVRFSLPENRQMRADPAFNLTEDQFVGYNSVLSEDFRSLIVIQ